MKVGFVYLTDGGRTYKKFNPEQAMKDQRWDRGTSILFL
jgi:hypothetical protein